MKRNQVIEAYIEEVSFPNKGIASVNGERVLVRGGIAGQKVKARIVKNKNGKIEADIIEVLEKSPVEQIPSCEHFGNCGGCAYQHLPYSEQLKLKESQVRALLEEGDIQGYEFLGIEPSPLEFAYRNKMEFTFGDVHKGGEMALGLHRKGSAFGVTTVSGCRIVDEDFRTVLSLVLDYFKQRDIPFYNKLRQEGVLRHLVLRKAFKTGELLVNLVTTSQQKLELGELTEKIKSTRFDGQLKGVLHTVNDNLADIVQSDETHILYGQDYITEEILGLKFKISAFSFFQTNSYGAEKLYSVVRDFAGQAGDRVVFDLYCGTGTIAQLMAPLARKVIGIEIVEEAVLAARENAKLNGLDNCEFIAGDVLKTIDELQERPDLIILDPPRDGVHPQALGKIIGFGCPEIVYVSCKPTSLVRDLQAFQLSGYSITKVKCVDMFPHTPHVETVVGLGRMG